MALFLLKKNLFIMKPMKKSKIIVILGPTASGKSDLAVKIAHKFNGEIISADSRQVYKGLDIGSGKITKKEMKGILHHLLDVFSPKKIFTVTQYQELAKKAVKKIIKKGKVPIVCGGTAFYINALIYDYKLPAVPPQEKLREKLERKITAELFKQLKKLDSKRAKNIDRYNKRRLIRALEIVLTAKKPIPVLATACGSKNCLYQTLKIGIKKPKKELKKLIKERLEKRLKMEMVDEVKKLHKNGLNWQRLDDFGLEYRYISRYLRNLISYEEMVEILNQKIWQFSKKQMTWFKKDKNIHWIKNYKEAERLFRQFLAD